MVRSPAPPARTTRPGRVAAGALAIIGVLLVLSHRTQTTGYPAGGVPARGAARDSARPRRAAVAATAPGLAPAAAADPDTVVLAGVRRRLARLRELDTEDAATRDTLLAELGAEVSDRNAAFLARQLAPAERVTPFGTLVIARWLAIEPAAAATWLRTIDDLTSEQIADLGHGIAVDPARTLLVTSTLGDSALAQPLLHAAVVALADRAPADALALAPRLVDEHQRADACETAVYAWASRDPLAAAHWIATVSDPAARERLGLLGAKALATSDPDLAASCLTAMPDTPSARQATLTVVEAWSTRDPAAAAAWVAALTAPTTRVEAALQVFSQWSATNAAAARAWLQTLPERDTILARLAAEAAERAADKT